MTGKQQVCVTTLLLIARGSTRLSASITLFWIRNRRSEQSTVRDGILQTHAPAGCSSRPVGRAKR